jgi:hypothetical protein
MLLWPSSVPMFFIFLLFYGAEFKITELKNDYKFLGVMVQFQRGV